MIHPVVLIGARLALPALIASCLGIACSDSPHVSDEHRPDAGGDERDSGPPSDAQRPAFCAREGDDDVRDLFCTGSTPAITSLDDLIRLLELRPVLDPPARSYPSDPFYGAATVAVLGHSTALSGRLVSPLNPRVITMGVRTFIAFQRGEQRVEVITQARDERMFAFYLLSFEQACNDAAAGCSHGDLFTPRIERDWLRIDARDGDDLRNTPEDCRTCHQRASQTPNLLMRELEAPWTHFFFPVVEVVDPLPGTTGMDLMEDYLQAKGDEPYAGSSLHAISFQAPFALQTRVGQRQPLLFDAPKIENERYPYSSGGYPDQPHRSPTWEAAYAAFKRGEQLALPYLDSRATDPDKSEALSEAYQRYLANEIGADELPDFADIFPDDPYERARRGLQSEPDASPEDTLIQACGSCHNDVLDQTISRALFNISLSRLDRDELDRAIDRIQRPSGSDGAMPPRDARQLDPGARERLVQYLMQDPELLDADGRLDHAARKGMAGGEGEREPAASAH